MFFWGWYGAAERGRFSGSFWPNVTVVADMEARGYVKSVVGRMQANGKALVVSKGYMPK